MKALSVKQPYAGLIIAGIKNIENRSWMTSYSGDLVIVSTKAPDARKWFDHERAKVARLGLKFPDRLCTVNGAALGVVSFRAMIVTTIEGTVESNHPNPAALDKTWWIPDLIGWIFENPRALAAPIPVVGRLGLYDLPEETARKIRAELGEIGS